MATDDDSNFFSRWSRRKAQVRSGEPLPPEPPVVPRAPPPAPVAPVAAAAAVVPPPIPQTEEPPPALTLDDVARLTPDSDYSAFVARGVPADVRNAAVKKLFTDPHYNVMDGLDIYIDDYSKPSPLSAVEMAKMVGAQFLKLVDDPEDKPERQARQDGAASAEPPVDPPADEAPPTIASDTDSSKPQDDHADLQLQPDHAPEPQGSGRGAG